MTNGLAKHRGTARLACGRRRATSGNLCKSPVAALFERRQRSNLLENRWRSQTAATARATFAEISKPVAGKPVIRHLLVRPKPSRGGLSVIQALACAASLLTTSPLA